MIAVSASEAKANLYALLFQAVRGEQVTITKHGVPVARLVPASAVGKLDTIAAIARLRELSRGTTLDGLSLKELIADGRIGSSRRPM